MKYAIWAVVVAGLAATGAVVNYNRSAADADQMVKVERLLADPAAAQKSAESAIGACLQGQFADEWQNPKIRTISSMFLIKTVDFAAHKNGGPADMQALLLEGAKGFTQQEEMQFVAVLRGHLMTRDGRACHIQHLFG